MTGIVAVLPMKPLALCKTRLSMILDDKERATLSIEMFRRVTKSALLSNVDYVWVVGGDQRVRSETLALGADWCHDMGHDLNESLSKAFSLAKRSKLVAMYIPADLPFLKSGDIDELISLSNDGETLVLSPAQRDGGTNGMLVPICSEFQPALGKNSFQRHREQIKALGADFEICESDGFALDLDTPEDFLICEQIDPDFRTTYIGAVQ